MEKTQNSNYQCQLCSKFSEEELISTNLNIQVCYDCWFVEFDCSFLSQAFDKITDKIYLGNAEGQKKKQLLKAIRITHILVVGKDLKIHHPNDFIYKQIHVEDDETEIISEYFEETYNFIENANGKVFVHCLGGVSRSPTIVIAFLMKKEKKRFEEIKKFVKSKRIHMSPNDGFLAQLKEYERKIF